MKWSDLINHLAALNGIEPWYYDIQGKRHETVLSTKVLVLSGLGSDVSSIAAAKASIALLEEEPWRHPLSPFIVERADTATIDLFLPAAESHVVRKWEIMYEAGDVAQGEFRAETLSLLGTREIEGRRIEHRRLEIGPNQPMGYHRFRVASDRAADATLALAPSRCYLPPALANAQRLWGIATHLYTLRSARNWGVGDFGDLTRLCALAAERGSSAVAVNPFHALFPGKPEEASPYSPSSRRFLNPIYIDVQAAIEADDSSQIRSLASSLVSLRAIDLVDYEKVWHAKNAAFEVLFSAFRHSNEGGAPQDFVHFVDEQGEALERFATYSALVEVYGTPWDRWPVSFRAPAIAVRSFARERPERIQFHRYLQYLADGQLRHASAQTRKAEMDIGIIRDLAVGVSPDGADAWSQQEAFAFGLRSGAPPDDFHPQGQEWGVLPFNPARLRANPSLFAELLQANMRYAGGLRIDHVVGLQRQFVVPLGAEPNEGCYIRFPFDDLLGILALESHRNRCLVIGEDLGTIPEGFRQRMEERDIFGCVLLYFEHNCGGGFKPPGDYRRKAVASVASHDLPTLAGYWEGRDIAVRKQVGIYDDTRAETAQSERAQDRMYLLEAIFKAELPTDNGASTAMNLPLRRAIHAFLAASSSQIFLAQLDDLLGEREQINVPGTTTAYANWRRKLSVCLEDSIFADTLDELARICADQGRGHTDRN